MVIHKICLVNGEVAAKNIYIFALVIHKKIGWFNFFFNNSLSLFSGLFPFLYQYFLLFVLIVVLSFFSKWSVFRYFSSFRFCVWFFSLIEISIFLFQYFFFFAENRFELSGGIFLFLYSGFCFFPKTSERYDSWTRTDFCAGAHKSTLPRREFQCSKQCSQAIWLNQRIMGKRANERNEYRDK